jgi:hypothetical protein
MCRHFDVMEIFFLHSKIWRLNLGTKQGLGQNATAHTLFGQHGTPSVRKNMQLWVACHKK